MTPDDLSAENELPEQGSPATPTPEVEATPNPEAPSPELKDDSEPIADSGPTTEGSPTARRRWVADLSVAFRQHVPQFLIPVVLLLLVTAIVVSLGSGLLLLGTSELEIGPIVIAWTVVAAALGVLLIGLSALWFATRASQSPPSSPQCGSPHDH